jgi:hypothetical protein
MKLFSRWTIIVFACVSISIPAFAHDAWLAAKWNTNKTRVLISALVAEKFPNGQPIKDWSRFIDPSAHTIGSGQTLLKGDASDSTILGSVPPASGIILTAGVKQREIKLNRDLAQLVLTEEFGLTIDEASVYLTPGIEEFQETYSRYLKTIVSLGGTSPSPKDSAIGLPLELVLLSWRQGADGKTSIRVRVLDHGNTVANAPVRILQEEKTKTVRANHAGEVETTVDSALPVLLAYTKVTKVSDTQLNSLWTNLAIYHLAK